MLQNDRLKILIVDNYDSFTFNLYQVFGSLPEVDVEVFRNDAISLKEIRDKHYDAIVLSPGPGSPKVERDFGICKDIIETLKDEIPILGVCLGHQGMGYVLNADIIKAPRILHGKTSRIHHSGEDLFAGVPYAIRVARYHSLIIDRETLPDSLKVTAETADGEVMAIQHRKYPLFGVQFHPESFLTEYGVEIIQNFVKIVHSEKVLIMEV